jgi:hypothetical protein
MAAMATLAAFTALALALALAVAPDGLDDLDLGHGHYPLALSGCQSRGR